jgi:hypothetical protein
VDQGGWLARTLNIINQKIDTVLWILRQDQHNEKLLNTKLDLLLKNQAADHLLIEKIVQELNPPPPVVAGFKAVLTVNKGETMTPLKKAAGVSASLTINDDGTASLNILFADPEGLDITTLTTWPSAVAFPTVAPSDGTPGPSAYSYAPASSPAPSTEVAGAFVAGTISVVAPPSTPPPSGWGQSVDFQISIASGLTNQTAPITEDAGTLSVTADASKPAGFSAVIAEP